MKQLIDDAELRSVKLPVVKIMLRDNEAVYEKYQQDIFDPGLPIENRRFIFDQYICEPSLMATLPDRRGATLLRCVLDWSSGTQTMRFGDKRKAFAQLIKLKPYLSKKFTSEELVPKLKGADLAMIDASDREQLLPPQLSSTPKSMKPIFKNQTFEQWLRVARRDRDAATKTNALTACAATAETVAEKKSLVALTRKLCREHGGNVVNKGDKGLYYEAMAQVLSSLDTNQISEFIEVEIAEGTDASRKFCSGWLIGLSVNFASKEWRSKIKSVTEMAGPIGDALASHLEAPGNSLILESLKYSSIKENFKDTALAKAIKRSAANPDQRLLLHKSIVVLMGDDLEMFQLLREDLLNPKTDPETRGKFLYALRHNHHHNQQRPLPRQWQKLLFDVANGVLRQDDQRLEFSQDFVYNGGGGVRDTGNRLMTEHVLWNVLISLNWLEPQLEAKFKTETLLPQLQELKNAVEKAAKDPERAEGFIAGNVKILLSNFDYMIKKALGDSDAEIPEDGFLKSGFSPWTSSGAGFGGGGGGVF